MSDYLLEKHHNYLAYLAMESHANKAPVDHYWAKDTHASKTDDLMDAWLQVRVL